MRRPSPSMAVAVVALVAALGGVAIASPIGGDGKVYLCYSQIAIDNPAASEGDYVVATNAGTPCSGDYPDQLAFNQAGPEGKTGPTGPTGVSGPQGADGGTKVLPKDVVKDVLDEMKKADKLADKQRDRLTDLQRQIERAKEDAQRQQEYMLWRKQQQLIESITQITNAITAMADANRRVIRSID